MIPYQSQAQRRFMHAAHPAIAKRWDKEYPNQKGLPEHVKKKKLKIVVNNKLRGDYGTMDPKTNRIEINRKAHKKDNAELASTIKHEMLHVKHPKMTERQAYKRSAKSRIPVMEQHKLIAKLRHKKMHYKQGALKRKLKMKKGEKVEPGTFIRKAKELTKKQVAIRGLI